jgi:hypothetical protein
MTQSGTYEYAYEAIEEQRLKLLVRQVQFSVQILHGEV